jgi:CYTH domain-containing protein
MPESSPKYSVVERERRFLVDPALAPALDPATARLIEDRYLPGTGLRLRRVTAPDGSIVYKLGKKYPGAGLSSRSMTNIYLDAAEYGALAALPAALLVKRRHEAGDGFVIDVFEGALAGLMLAEISADDDAALAAIIAPPWCAVEVTKDVAYIGGTLAIEGWHATAAPRIVTIAKGDER